VKAARPDGATTGQARDRALGLLLGCHPLPCVAVTAFATAYAAAIGADRDRLVALAVTVLAGQLAVGWSNDAIDGPRDRAARRPDKPVSAGLIDSRTLAVAALIAAVVCAILSLRLGAVAGWLHLVAVASAVSYNAVLKSTVLSPLPYLISFGLLPVVVTYAVAGHGPVPLAHVVAATLLGGAAHAGNTVGDTEADAATGVRGLPQRLGPQWSLIAMAMLVAGAALVLLGTVLADDVTDQWRRVSAGVLLLTGVVLAAAGAFRRVGVPGGPGAWRLTLLAVTLVIAGFLTAV
jgi:4-hydroxybenzoate polyprenyltransferase